jgi:hypothetical protein
MGKNDVPETHPDPNGPFGQVGVAVKNPPRRREEEEAPQGRNPKLDHLYGKTLDGQWENPVAPAVVVTGPRRRVKKAAVKAGTPDEETDQSKD